MKNSLLLHVCCADCLSKAVGALHIDDKQSFDNDAITLYFDNSNIHPRTEWIARLEAVKTVAEGLDLELIVADWSPKGWYEAIEHNPDNTGLRRCKACWKLRLQSTAERAHHLDFKYFSSTLLSSQYQSKREIEGIGKSLENNSGFMTFSVDNDCKVPKGIYRQNYCGCVYSLVGRYEEKWAK